VTKVSIDALQTLSLHAVGKALEKGYVLPSDEVTHSQLLEAIVALPTSKANVPTLKRFSRYTNEKQMRRAAHKKLTVINRALAKKQYQARINLLKKKYSSLIFTGANPSLPAYLANDSEVSVEQRKKQIKTWMDRKRKAHQSEHISPWLSRIFPPSVGDPNNL